VWPGGGQDAKVEKADWWFGGLVRLGKGMFAALRVQRWEGRGGRGGWGKGKQEKTEEKEGPREREWVRQR